MSARSYIVFLFFVLSGTMYGQVFTNATTAAMPVGYNSLGNTIAVSGLATSLNGTSIGLQQVEVTFTANAFQNIELFLISPNNRMVRLFSRLNSNSLNTLNGTFTFSMFPANPAIRFWTPVSPPPAAAFLPDVSLNSVNDGTDPNGTWKLFGRGIGNSVTNFKITFGTFNIAPMKVNDDCSGATSLINTRVSGGFINATNTNYGSSLPPLDKGPNVCSGSTYSENTAWYTWIAACADDSIAIKDYAGVQTGIIKGTCSLPTLLQCTTVLLTSNYYTYKSLGLTPGTRYYLVFDGNEALGVNYEIRYYPGACFLPITLLYLHSEYDPTSTLINLDWQTAMENNNKGFYVETRLVGSEEFIVRGFVPSQNSSSGSTYSFSFKPEKPGLYETRLIQEDIDGKTTTSSSSFVNVRNKENSLEVYYTDEQTPVASFFIPEPEKIYYEIINLQGIKVFSSSISGKKGSNILDISLSLPPAVYFLQVHTKNKAATSKYVILK